MSLSENDLWLLSFYRSSEINGALFFGRIARTIRGPLQADVTHHFADEAAHARYWSRCIADLGSDSLNLGRTYQDQYFETIGAPANLMEVMAITHVFEKRAIHLYRHHLRYERTQPLVRQTIERIMKDERWHVSYVRDALNAMGERYGADHVQATVNRYSEADEEIYANTLAEYGERMEFLREKR